MCHPVLFSLIFTQGSVMIVYSISDKLNLQKWIDYKLRWDPGEYGGVDMLYVPSQHIWLPDIVLFNK